jgi:glycosyltransferase involved in cell wall biosynthesis
VPDVRPYYAQASVFIVPLRLGGGTRLKIVEAMAMGIPVVSTTVGAEGLDTRPGEDIWIANDPMSFAQGVLHLLSDAELRRRLIAGGRDLARRYDWTELTKPYADLAAATVQRWTSKRTTCASPG